jgi:hypothetical protein
MHEARRAVHQSGLCLRRRQNAAPPIEAAAASASAVPIAGIAEACVLARCDAARLAAGNDVVGEAAAAFIVEADGTVEADVLREALDVRRWCADAAVFVPAGEDCELPARCWPAAGAPAGPAWCCSAG